MKKKLLKIQSEIDEIVNRFEESGQIEFQEIVIAKECLQGFRIENGIKSYKPKKEFYKKKIIKNEIIQLIKNELKLNEDFTKLEKLNLDRFSEFVEKMIYNRVEKKLNITQLIDLYLKEIEDKSLDMSILVYLDGIEFEEYPVCIEMQNSLKISFTQPESDELCIEYNNEMISNEKLVVPYCIARLSWKGKKNSIKEHLNRLMISLRIASMGSVKYLKYVVTSEMIFHPNFYYVDDTSFGKSFLKYMISRQYKERFSSLFSKIWYILPESLYDSNNKGPNHLILAYRRYCDALFQDKIEIESRITKSIIGLEALFLAENYELKYRLSLRCAKLLSIIGIDPIQVRLMIGLAYDVRSKYSHGKSLSRDLRKKMKRSVDAKLVNGILGQNEIDVLLTNLGAFICNTLRFSLVFFAILDKENFNLEFTKFILEKGLFQKEDFGHENFLKKLDDSLVDNKVFQVLAEYFHGQEVIKAFEIKGNYEKK